MHIILHSTQAFGDSLIFTHITKFIKKHISNCHITFMLNYNATLTTQENDPSNLYQMCEILLLQNGIDSIAMIKEGSAYHLMGHKIPNDQNIKLIRFNEWYSDLGIVNSAFTDLFQIGLYEYDTETSFWFGKEPTRSKNKLHIATLGPLDWNKKYGNEFGRKQVLAYLTSLKNVEVHEFGIDIKKQTYLQALQEMQNCHLYIGPAGSLGHAAAGVGMDTIVLCEVFPPKNLSPEYYHSGYHKSIVATKENHCGTYKCITPKNFDLMHSQEGWGNPTVEWGKFWVQDCKYMPSGKSCIASITPNQIIEKFTEWYSTRSNDWLK